MVLNRLVAGKFSVEEEAELERLETSQTKLASVPLWLKAVSAQKPKYSNTTNAVSRRKGLGRAARRVVSSLTKFFPLIGLSFSTSSSELPSFTLHSYFILLLV